MQVREAGTQVSLSERARLVKASGTCGEAQLTLELGEVACPQLLASSPVTWGQQLKLEYSCLRSP